MIDIKLNQTHLSLTYKNIGNEQLVELCKWLENNRSISSIDLRGNMIGDEGMECFASCLKINKSIEWVDLSQNEIGDDGIKHLSKALKENQSIVLLNLSENRIGYKGMKDLFNCLKHDNFTIMSCSLIRNFIFDYDLDPIYSLCRRNQNKKTIIYFILCVGLIEDKLKLSFKIPKPIIKEIIKELYF